MARLNRAPKAGSPLIVIATALPSCSKPRLHMDAVGPEVNVMLGGEIALAPAHILLRLGCSDGGRRQPAGIFAEQRDQRLLKVASGDPLEVEVGIQHLEGL